MFRLIILTNALDLGWTRHPWWRPIHGNILKIKRLLWTLNVAFNWCVLKNNRIVSLYPYLLSYIISLRTSEVSRWKAAENQHLIKKHLDPLQKWGSKTQSYRLTEHNVETLSWKRQHRIVSNNVMVHWELQKHTFPFHIIEFSSELYRPMFETIV